jgi:hypothetical protein
VKRKPSKFDLEIKRLTAKAIKDSLATIGLILETKFRPRP